MATPTRASVGERSLDLTKLLLFLREQLWCILLGTLVGATLAYVHYRRTPPAFVLQAVLGAMSRCSSQKDPLTLYRALAVARTLRPDLVLFHIGAGELDPEIDDYVRQHGLEKNVVRRPRIAEPVEFYQAVDGFILTSRYEGLSLALLEALSCDLPLILSEAPGNGDVLSLPLNRLWSSPVGRADAFAAAIEFWTRTLNDPDLPSCNHREIALERFDERDCFRRVLRLYAQLVEPRLVPACAFAPRRPPACRRELRQEGLMSHAPASRRPTDNPAGVTTCPPAPWARGSRRVETRGRPTRA